VGLERLHHAGSEALPVDGRLLALVFNWWNLFTRLADPDHHREAITSRPLLLQAIARQTTHAGRTTLTVTSTHGERDRARKAFTRIAARIQA
jgi:hypothetical protein